MSVAHPMAEKCGACGHKRGEHDLVLPGRLAPACIRNVLDQRRGCYVGCTCPEFKSPSGTLIDVAESMRQRRARLGIPALPMPPEDAPPPPRPHNETERDDDQRNEESER